MPKRQNKIQETEGEQEEKSFFRLLLGLFIAKRKGTTDPSFLQLCLGMVTGKRYPIARENRYYRGLVVPTKFMKRLFWRFGVRFLAVAIYIAILLIYAIYFSP